MALGCRYRMVASQCMTPADFGQASAASRALAGPGRWWAPLVLASEWTGGQLRPGPEFVRRPRRLGADLAATLLDWECPHQALQGVQDRQGPRQKLGWRT